MKPVFTDEEHRILLSAMSREKTICERIDKEEAGPVSLTELCNSILGKIYKLQHHGIDIWLISGKTENIGAWEVELFSSETECKKIFNYYVGEYGFNVEKTADGEIASDGYRNVFWWEKRKI